MLKFNITVNINRTTKFKHHCRLLKQLLLRYCQDIAKTIVGVLNPVCKAIQGVIHRSFWMQHQR